MRIDEDALLVAALGDVGGMVDGRRGAEIGARRLKKNILEIDLALDLPPQAAADLVRQVLREKGKALNLTTEDGPATQVLGIVGAGIANMNPAVVTVTIDQAGNGSRLLIRGVAKEGLIKQRAGEAAAKRVAAALT
ncbi:MAG: hypothetical protein ACRDND_16945 [Streptosporangiaceae bacterium]